MKLRLWSTILGIVIGILLGAGGAYAATVYQNSADIPVSVEVGDMPVTYSPGLDVSPTAISFSIEPGGKSNIVSVTVKNVGDEVVDGLKVSIPDMPYELRLRDTRASSSSYSWGAGWQLSYYNLNIQPEHSVIFNIYLEASTDTTPGSYDFNLQVEEIH